MAGPDADVVIAGDGPAGLALGAACRAAGLAVTVVGPGAPWTATYGTWRDDVVDVPDECFAHVSPTVVVHGHRRHVLQRAYAIVDNDALRAHLGAGLARELAVAGRVQHFAWGSRVVTDVGALDARLVVDATGRPNALAADGPAERSAAQTAFGVVVDGPPPPYDGDGVVLMDLRPLPGAVQPTFCYVVPVSDGWLVEETVLVSRPPIAPAELRGPLRQRVGGAVVAAAQREEAVAIPVGGRLPGRRGAVVPFGAAAGYTHPATGFSIAASLRAAGRVGTAIASAVGGAGGARPDTRPIHEAVWPAALRRTRRLHDYGAEVLLRLDPGRLATFFDAFFDLPVGVWAPYLRIDAPPSAVSRTMTGLLRRLPWSARAGLVVNPFGGR